MAKGVVTVTLNPALDQSLDCPGFRAGAVNRVTACRTDPGGKGINVAAFLADWLRPVAATGFLGRDNAQPFERLFAVKGIADHCRRLDGQTRINLKILDQAAGSVTDTSLPGLAPSAEDWTRLTGQIERLAEDNAWFVLAGSLPTGVPAFAYAALTGLLRGRGCRVALDASGPALRLGVAEAPDLIKPNLAELRELVGRPLPGRGDVLAAARELLAGGIGVVVVSLGPEGAILAGPGGAVHAEPPPTRVVSTVGAGDAMLAGVLVGLARGEDPADCLRRGTAFAVGTLTRPGPVLPPPDETEALMRAVRITEAV